MDVWLQSSKPSRDSLNKKDTDEDKDKKTESKPGTEL
jgi:hypothetical protein